jgi:hypothetical protein
MTTVDRVAQLEGLETSTDLAVGWLARAHEFPTAMAWRQAQARDGGSDDVRFRRDVERIVAARQPPIEERERLRRTLYAEVFLRCSLAIGLDAHVREAAQRDDLVLHLILAWGGNMEPPTPTSTTVSSEAKPGSTEHPHLIAQVGPFAGLAG